MTHTHTHTHGEVYMCVCVGGVPNGREVRSTNLVPVFHFSITHHHGHWRNDVVHQVQQLQHK